MKFKNEEQKEIWGSIIKANTDGYGMAVCKYAIQWATMMEQLIDNDIALPDAAEETRYSAARGLGLTIAQANFATKMLSQCWKYGEELRDWYNKKYLSKEDYEKAKEEGSIVQTHLFSIG